MGIQDHPEFRDHENVVFCRDAEAGVFAIIAVHSTRLGPAAGGCRMRDYKCEEEALEDALRLAFAMTYKNAVAGLPLGGGKTVVMGDPAATNKETILRAVARHVKRLGGLYWSAIDVGVSPADVDIMAEECPYVFARESQFPAGTNCETFTSHGGLSAFRATVRHCFGRDNLEGIHVGMQGVGQVGIDLCRRLHAAGARLTVTDIDEEAVARAVQNYGAKAVGPDEIYDQEVDVFSPCALGATLNDRTIPRLKAKAVCGMANNQLAEARHDAELMRQGIVWAPDYVVNAGGMLGSSGPVYGEKDQAKLQSRVEGIGDVLATILQRASSEGKPPGRIADILAEERIAAG